MIPSEQQIRPIAMANVSLIIF